MGCRLPLVAFVVLSVVPAAPSADQTILGSAFTVKDPGTAAKRKITVTAKESASPDSLVGDPTAGGASVTITANGATSSAETYALPAGTSPTTLKPFWTGDALKGFKYRDAKGENGPVKLAQIKVSNGTFRLKVGLDGKLGPIGVVPPNPGSDGCVLLTIVGGDSYSVRFADGKLTNNGPELFKVAKPTTEGSCVTTTTTTTSTSSSTTTSSSTSTTLPSLPFLTPPGPAPLRYRDLVFDTVDTTTDIVYGSATNIAGQTITLTLDLYEPALDTATARPAIVWVHGGSFAAGDKTSPELVDEANTFSRKGYVNVSINYRLEPPGCTAAVPTLTCVIAIGEALQDAQTAVRFLRTNAATYGVDESRIAIGGSSAGAITALNVGFSSGEDATAAVAAAVSLSGGRLLGTVGPGDAPSLLFHGTADPIVPYQWAVDTLNAATAAGLDSFLTTWEGAGHVPYVQHRTEILDQTTNFLYWELQ
ncbi:MAG TPA: alpha/beta hydrolase [Candidatus Eisenbacteria bacterium]|nr:alpha/beta hydrolase [Candidatus Eisenbacteria bacterium]